MQINKISKKGTSNGVFALFLAFVVLMVIGVVFWAAKRPDSGANGGQDKPETVVTDPNDDLDTPIIPQATPTPERRLQMGRSVTREEMRVIFSGRMDQPLPAINDPERLRAVFRENTKYQKEGLTTISGRANSKAWGIDGFADFVMAVRGKSLVLIHSNDGREIQASIDILESTVLEFRLDPGVRIDLGRRFHDAYDITNITLEILGITGLPPGSSRRIEDLANLFLTSEEARKFLKNALENDNVIDTVKNLGFQFIEPPSIEGLHGTRFLVEYKDGEGVQNITFVGYLEGYERKIGDEDPFVFLKDTLPLFQASMFADPHLFPAEPLRDGEIFNIDAQAIPAPFPPEWHAQMSGTLSFGRYDENNHNAEIYYRRGSFRLEGRPEGRLIQGNFSPSSGEIHFFTQPEQMDRLQLKGEASFEDRSTGHWLFESRHQMTPTFETQYRVKIVESGNN